MGSANRERIVSSTVETVQPKQGTWQTYDATDGLPGGVWCLLQDRKGFLWLGTEVGLCRYDGTEFITYTTADGLAHNYVYAICEDGEGRLWFGTRGGGVSCYNGKDFVNYTTAQGLADDHVSAICEDSQGWLWFGTDSGVSCFDGQDFRNYTISDGLGHNTIQSIYEDSQGQIWFGTGWWDKVGQGVSCFDGQGFTNYTTENGLPYDSVMVICEDRRGQMWFGTWGGGLCRSDGRSFTTYTTEDGLASSFAFAICEDSQGHLWFGGAKGVSCFDGQNFVTYTTEDGLLDNRVLDIIQDREGNLWFANPFGGLSRFDSETLQLLTEEPVSEMLIQDKQGGLWFSNENELCFFREGQLRRRILAPTALIYGILADSGGGIWIGTFEDGLYYYDSPDAVWDCDGKHFAFGNELPDSKGVSSLIEARDGTIWVGTEGNTGYLCRAIRSKSLTKPGLKQGDVNAFEAIPTPYIMTHRLFEDSRGRIFIGGWVWAGGGMAGGGLSHYDKDNPEDLYNYTTEGGLLDDGVMSIVEDNSGNLWLGTSQGLYCYDDEHFVLYGKEQGLSCLIHQWSTRDANGRLWFGTLGGGVYRYNDKHFQILTTRDGLPSNSVTGLVAQPDGSMIIGTYRGIAHYRPTATMAPSVEIRKVMANKVYQSPTELELIANETRLLTISYHGLSLATHQMRYSYILEGHDAEWQDTWESQARYENLPVGEYTFKVIAINRDLVPSETPAILKLNIRPDSRDARITALETRVDNLQRRLGRKYSFENIIGHSYAIKQVQVRMEIAIESGLNVVVLITGATGTGKELVANAIHFNSSRRDGPLLTCNCAAIPKDLVQSTLFGHRKGAFTGAHEDRIGYFEAAEGGTLILDEIGDMPLEVQPNLLRVLEERKFSRVGDYTSQDADVRIIAIANQDLQKEAHEGRFRRDLYFRLTQFPIHLPTLQERLDDIPLLAEHFLQLYLEESDRQLDGFAPDVFVMLQSYSWPGNVRELQNAICEAADYAAQEGKLIQIRHFPPRIIHGESLIQEILSEQAGYRESVDSFGRRLIEKVLRESGGNRSEAARRLKTNPSNLRKLMRRLGIEEKKNR